MNRKPFTYGPSESPPELRHPHSPFLPAANIRGLWPAEPDRGQGRDQPELRGQLRAGVEVDATADVIAVLCDPQLLQTFVRDYDWTWDHWHTWTLNTLATLVLREDRQFHTVAAPSARRYRRPGVGIVQ